MVSFESDYNNGAHPKILAALMASNSEQLPGYGADAYCASAREKILRACDLPDGDVFFLVGGTQTNAVVISSLLRSYEGVIAAKTGHVSLHEAGAIECSGHKVIALPEWNGKLEAGAIASCLETFYGDESREHMTYPGMVYLSQPTEYGTLYTKEELTAISQVCRQYDIPLYLDGARLGYGLMSPACDLTLPELAHLVDVFYIGGTKVGALCGEAVVFGAGKKPDHFFTQVKQRGALLAKGRLLGVQFDALFTDGLYFEIGRHAIRMAERMTAIFEALGFTFFLKSPTNQQFLLLDDGVMQKLREKVGFSFWEKADETHSVVRFATSWSTTEADLAELERALRDTRGTALLQ